ncbi:MAG: class I SAM-dependent methyltransferase, partial [Planctomycetota bacterium]
MSTEREGDSVATSYDRVPYASWPYANSHPNRLSTIARLMGIEPPRLDQMRVLELGCASGGNLIPMAEMFPSATFVGIDASSRQIEQGVERIETLGLENIELRTADLETVESPPTPFDFIITHGVYSWVPPSVQKAILRISHDWLSPNGVAYISYNTNPGWK